MTEYVVPSELTAEMEEAIQDALEDCYKPKQLYSALLAAAPKPSAEPVAVDFVHLADMLYARGYNDCERKVFDPRKAEEWHEMVNASQPSAVGSIVVTWSEDQKTILAVTRQDDDGKVLSVIAEAPAVEAQEQTCKHDLQVKNNASRYEILRRNVCIVGSEFHILNLAPRYVAPCAAIELDAVLDACQGSVADAQEQPAPVPSCEWHEDEDGIWETSCGQSWTFPEGGPEDNGMKFCHQCGKHLIARPQNPEADA